MRRALVTGAAGMIGSNLVKQLLSEGVYVLGVDNLSGGNRDFLPEEEAEKFGFVKCDVLSHEFEQLVEGFRPTVIYHLSAYAAECLSPWIRGYNARNNYEATARIVSLAMANEVPHIVYTSSAAVYGHTDGYACEKKASPGDPYGITKLASEMDIHDAHDRWGLRYTVFRPHNVYGPNQNLWDKYRNVVGIFMRQIMADEPMTIYGDGSQIRQFTDVRDVVEIMAQADVDERLWDQTFNIGCNVETSVDALAHVIKDVAGFGEIKNLPPRNEAHVVHVNHTKLRTAGYECETPLFPGVMNMWKWAQTAPHWEPTFPKAEHRVGLYSYWDGDE